MNLSHGEFVPRETAVSAPREVVHRVRESQYRIKQLEPKWA